MNPVRKNTAQMECFRRIITLSRIPDAEAWLHHMAMNGLILDHICGHKFYFKRTAGRCIYYFLLNSDIGASSEDWVYYEFLQMGGNRIPFQGSSLFSPRLVLAIDICTYQDNGDLYRYYYSYRNYRALHRLRRNAFVCVLGIAICLLLYVLQAIGLWFLAQYGGIFLFLCIFQILSILHYIRLCKSQEQPCDWRRPNRPGYGGE